MQRLRIILLTLAALLFFSTEAKAADYGRYLCNECAIGPDGASTSLPDIVTFLRYTKVTDLWNQNDTITVCNGGYCILIAFKGSVWIQAGVPPVPDSGKSYKNATSISGSANDNYHYTVVVVSWLVADSGWDHYTVTVGDITPVGFEAGDDGGVGDWGEDTAQDASYSYAPPREGGTQY